MSKVVAIAKRARDLEKITQEEALEIIEKRERRGLFWLREHTRYIGIDNRTGDAWVEEFLTWQACKAWLRKNE